MKKNTEISDRIRKIIDDQCISPNYFATKLGYDRAQTVYDIINGKSAPSYDFFNKFMMSEYSDIYNIDWIITGRGVMTYGMEAVVESERLRIKKNKKIEPSESYSVMTHLIDKIADLSAENERLKIEKENLEKELKNKGIVRPHDSMVAEP